jgi:hypothetical protein
MHVISAIHCKRTELERRQSNPDGERVPEDLIARTVSEVLFIPTWAPGLASWLTRDFGPIEFV